MIIPDVLPLLHDFARAPGNEVGGHLRLVFDDANVADEQVRYCLEQAETEGDDLAVEVAQTLLSMSRPQRSKLAGMFYELQAITLSCDDVVHETSPDQPTDVRVRLGEPDELTVAAST